MSSTLSKTKFKFSITFFLLCANAVDLDLARNSPFGKDLTLSKTSPCFYGSAVQVLKTLEKGEIAHNEQFLLFPQRFLPFQRSFHHFNQI